MRRTLVLQQVDWALTTAGRNIALSKYSNVAINGSELSFTGGSLKEAEATPILYTLGNSKVFTTIKMPGLQKHLRLQ